MAIAATVRLSGEDVARLSGRSARRRAVRSGTTARSSPRASTAASTAAPIPLARLWRLGLLPAEATGELARTLRASGVVVDGRNAARPSLEPEARSGRMLVAS